MTMSMLAANDSDTDNQEENADDNRHHCHDARNAGKRRDAGDRHDCSDSSTGATLLIWGLPMT